jgi:hypothetical protein
LPGSPLSGHLPFVAFSLSGPLSLSVVLAEHPRCTGTFPRLLVIVVVWVYDPACRRVPPLADGVVLFLVGRFSRYLPVARLL